MHRELMMGLSTWSKFVCIAKKKIFLRTSRRSRIYVDTASASRRSRNASRPGKGATAVLRFGRGFYYPLPAESGTVRIKDVSWQLAAAFTKWSGRSFALSKRHSLHDDSVKRLANLLKRWLRWKRNRAFLKWTAIIGAANLTKRVL